MENKVHDPEFWEQVRKEYLEFLDNLIDNTRFTICWNTELFPQYWKHNEEFVSSTRNLATFFLQEMSKHYKNCAIGNAYLFKASNTFEEREVRKDFLNWVVNHTKSMKHD